MTIHHTSLGRRGFLVSGAAVAGGFSLGFHIPFDGGQAHAQTVKELNAWVVIHPDDRALRAAWNAAQASWGGEVGKY